MIRILERTESVKTNQEQIETLQKYVTKSERQLRCELGDFIHTVNSSINRWRSTYVYGSSTLEGGYSAGN